MDSDLENSHKYQIICRICRDDGVFEISENKFFYEDAEVLLSTAFYSFSTLENSDVQIHLCSTCTDSLVAAYTFWQQVKQSDSKFFNEQNIEELKELIDEETEANKNRNSYEDDQNLVELYEVDFDDIEDDEIIDKSPKKTQNSSPSKRRPSKRAKKNTITNHSKSDNNVCIGLPQFLISSETAHDPLETTNQNYQLDDIITEDESIADIDGYSSRNNVKTLTASAVMTPDLHEIGDICMESMEGESDGQSIYKCKFCPKAFAAPYHLMVHTRKSHMCQYCLATFVKVNDLYKHVKETHNSFDCLLCGRTFRTNGNLRQHMRRNHSVFLPAHVSLLNVNDIKTSES